LRFNGCEWLHFTVYALASGLFATMTESPVRQEVSMPRYQRTQVVLRTGTPNVDPATSGSAVAIVVNDTPYISDCGPTVVHRAAATNRPGAYASLDLK